MSIALLLWLKVLIASLIVGFVTASIKSWVDRFFLVILLTSLVGLPITHSIMINLIVVALASLMMALRQGSVIKSVREDWVLIVLPAVLGGIIGRLVGLNVKAVVLLAILGVYAILTGLRMIFIKPLRERDDKLHPNWQVPIAFFFGGLIGLISAGGKPFSVPFYNWVMGHHPQRAYALSSLGVTVAAWSAIGAQMATGSAITPRDLGLAVYAFILITLTALGVERIWTPKLNQIVTWIVAPVLVLVGIRFIYTAYLIG